MGMKAQEQAAKTEQHQKPRAPNDVYVGKKGAATYALAAAMVLKSHGYATVKARGRNINTLVSAVEILRRRIVPEANIESISIGTDEVEMRDGRKRPRSTMVIILSLPGKK